MSCRPDSYKELQTCMNCSKCFKFEEYDQGYDYYCNKDNDRPKCGSVSMDECHGDDFFHLSDREIYEQERIKERDAWNLWAENHIVSPNGCCDEINVVE